MTIIIKKLSLNKKLKSKLFSFENKKMGNKSVVEYVGPISDLKLM